jgi:hypothetical protein
VCLIALAGSLEKIKFDGYIFGLWALVKNYPKFINSIILVIGYSHAKEDVRSATLELHESIMGTINFP